LNTGAASWLWIEDIKIGLPANIAGNKELFCCSLTGQNSYLHIGHFSDDMLICSPEDSMGEALP